MLTSRRPAPVTFVFLTVSAGWFVADRYVGFGIYRAVGEAVNLGLTSLVMLAFSAVIIVSLIRSWRSGTVEWMTVTTAIALLLVAELAWLVIIAPLPANGFEVAALVMDAGTPLVAVLGLAAAVTEGWSLIYWRRGEAGSDGAIPTGG